MSRLPLIGVTVCTKQVGLYSYHIVADKQVHAIAIGAGGLPQLTSAYSDSLDLPVRPAKRHGRLFSRASAKVQRHHISGLSCTPGNQPTSKRVHAPRSLIKAAITAGVPVVSICARYPLASRVAASSKFASPRNFQGFR